MLLGPLRDDGFVRKFGIAALGVGALFVSPALALVAGVAVAVTVGNPWPKRTRAAAQKLLAGSVIGLGAGMDLAVVGRVGLHGLGYTAVGIAVTLSLGFLLARALRVPRDTGILVSAGTAICGGSAIAAVAPTIGARDEEVSLALGAVFLLNAVALLVFPPIGHALGLTQDQFGLWSALAIHDTSSVVGAASQYGAHALAVATAAKLARALWIVPVTIAIAARRRRQLAAADPAASARLRVAPKRPWFIAGFVAAAALVTFVPVLAPAGKLVAAGAHHVLAVTLYLIGLGLTRPALRALGLRPMLQATALWIAMASLTLGAIVLGAIA